MKIDVTTLELMNKSGIFFVANIKIPGGSKTIYLNPESILEFINDPEEFAAKYFDVSKSNYLYWVESEGVPRCGAKTISNKRCKNVISGGIQRSLKDWLRLEGDYCTVHGGETSVEARSKFRRK